MSRVMALRSAITAKHLTVFERIWHDYAEQGVWTAARKLHLEFDKTTVRDALDPAGRGLVEEHLASDNLQARYELTMLGCLVADRSGRALDLVVQFLSFARQRFRSDPEVTEIKSMEMVHEPGLPSLDRQVMGRLVRRLSGLSICRGGNWGDVDWTIQLSDDVADLPEPSSLPSWLEERLFEGFDPNCPVWERERRDYHDQRRQRSSPDDLGFIAEPSLREWVRTDYMEALTVYDAGAWKSTIVLSGGLLEALTLEVLARSPKNGARIDENSVGEELRKRQSHPLSALLDEAAQRNLLPKELVHLSNAVREYRNLIHPGKESRYSGAISETTATIALNAVRTLMDYVRHASVDRGADS